MQETNASESPPPARDSSDGERRRTWLATCAADTLHFVGNARRNFIRYATRQLVLAPQPAASGVVLTPQRAYRLERWRAVYDSGFVFAFLGLLPLLFVISEVGWGSALILFFLVGWFALIAWIVMVLAWRNSIGAVYEAMPPPGTVITADAGALTVNGIVVPWPQIVLKAIWLREGTQFWYGAWWNMRDFIDRLALNAGGEVLMLDRHVLTGGQVLLDTICDKLDMQASPPPAPGDVKAPNLTLYPGRGGDAAGVPRGAAMTTFDKREEGFEKKFAHDEELKFKAMARRNKLLGLWAAGVLGKSGAEAEAYAKEVVLADFEEAGDNDVVRKVVKDLAPKNVGEPQIRAKMNEFLAQAVAQIQAGR